MVRERWTRRVLVGAGLVAVAAVASVSCVGQSPTLPTTCADLLAYVGSAAPDGDYVIQPAGRTPFTVYCAGMSTGAPAEYLSLVRTYGNGVSATNVSAYDCVNCKDSAYTYFEKVRIDPATLQVDTTDLTFTTFVTGDPTCWASIGGACGSARSLRFGEAANCLKTGWTPGSIDLRGTTFSIDPVVTMIWDGFMSYGTDTFTPDRKLVTFSGGGDCGGIHPTGWNLALQQD